MAAASSRRGRQVAGENVQAAEIDPGERDVEGQPMPCRDLPAPAQVAAGEPDVAGLQVNQAAVVERLDQIERAVLAQQRYRGVVLPQCLIVAAGPLQQQSALAVQDRPLGRRGDPLSLVEQPESGLNPAAFRLRPGEAEQQPAPELQQRGIIAGGAAVDEPQARAQLPDGERRPTVVAGCHADRVQPGSPRPYVHVTGCSAPLAMSCVRLNPAARAGVNTQQCYGPSPAIRCAARAPVRFACRYGKPEPRCAASSRSAPAPAWRQAP